MRESARLLDADKTIRDEDLRQKKEREREKKDLSCATKRAGVKGWTNILDRFEYFCRANFGPRFLGPRKNDHFDTGEDPARDGDREK